MARSPPAAAVDRASVRAICTAVGSCAGTVGANGPTGARRRSDGAGIWERHRCFVRPGARRSRAAASDTRSKVMANNVVDLHGHPIAAGDLTPESFPGPSPRAARMSECRIEARRRHGGTAPDCSQVFELRAHSCGAAEKRIDKAEFILDESLVSDDPRRREGATTFTLWSSPLPGFAGGDGRSMSRLSVLARPRGLGQVAHRLE
jgi:hypothetical protein